MAETGARVLSREECDAIGARVLERITVPEVQVSIESHVETTVDFARGDTNTSSEYQGSRITLSVNAQGRSAEVETNRLDDVGLTALVRETEALVQRHRTPGSGFRILGPQTYLAGPQIRFDSVLAMMPPEASIELVHRATAAAEARKLIAAGYLALSSSSRWVRTTSGLHAYEDETLSDFSVTARTQDGTGSGSGWSGFEDWRRVDVQGVIDRAIDLGERSAHPVALEPGRYTVILEPGAVSELVSSMMDWQAEYADRGITVYSKDPIGNNKIGLQMLDRSLSVWSSPWDPDMPGSTIHGDWTPIREPVTWFDRGVLVNLAYSEEYAEQKKRPAIRNPGGFRLASSAPAVTLEEMIATTKRGIWVNRFSHVFQMNRRTGLLSGVTRDGTFLIENGKITKPIKNFRFTESPFFVLNKLEGAGQPVRAGRSVVAPRLKVRDFDFTSLTDAI